jgi:hypothetical protein
MKQLGVIASKSILIEGQSLSRMLTSCRATDLNHTLVSLLRDLSERVQDDDRHKISDVLQDVCTSHMNIGRMMNTTESSSLQIEDDMVSQPHSAAPSTFSLGKRSRKGSDKDYQDTETVRHGEAYVTASTGSNEDLDHLDEDLTRNRESRETGYVGQNSEVKWLLSVQRQTENTGNEPQEQSHGPPGSGQQAIGERSEALHVRRQYTKDNDRQGSMTHVTDSTFYLDSHNIDIDILVDPMDFPDPIHAERLLDCYTSTVHSTFPLVSFQQPVSIESSTDLEFQYPRYPLVSKGKSASTLGHIKTMHSSRCPIGGGPK